MVRKIAVTLIAAAALVAGPAGAASATPAQPGSGSAAASASLQKRVDAVLTAVPGGRQVSATKIQYDGLVVTFDASADATTKAYAPSDIICSSGWFCIIVRGTTFSFYKCQMWDLSNWWGSSPFKNAQTKDTVFKAFDANYAEVWSNKAPDNGYVDVTPWWHLKPCGN